MKISFYANLRTIVDNAVLNISDTNIQTLSQLFERLVELYPEINLHLFDDQGNLRSDVPLFVNGRNPRLTSVGINVSLQPDDEISIFSPISSGRMNVEVMRAPGIDKQE